MKQIYATLEMILMLAPIASFQEEKVMQLACHLRQYRGPGAFDGSAALVAAFAKDRFGEYLIAAFGSDPDAALQLFVGGMRLVLRPRR